MRLVRFGQFEANFTTGELCKHGIRLKLQDQPFQVLRMLLTRPGELVTREEIRRTLWPSGTFVDFDNGLNAAVNRLREALNDSAENPKFIETLPRRGYRFIGAVDDAAGLGDKPFAPAYPPQDLEQLARETDFGAPRGAKSLAVLYFENLSGAKEDEYFRDGITEDVTTELSKIGELTLFPRSAVFAFRDKPVTAPQVGHHLAAAHVLEGSLRRAGNRLRITTHLVETCTGHTLWAERYDREMKDVFEVQDEIARSISQALRIKLSPKEERAIAHKSTKSAQAYDYYLRGRQYFHQMRRNSFDFARQMFARAIEVDPCYARAYAGVADCCSFLCMHWGSSDDDLQKAAAASRKALELDPNLAEAHASRGLALSLRETWQDAQREFETAIQINPKLFEAYYFFARICFRQGKLARAAELYEQACRANPDDYQAPGLLADVYRSLGREAEAATTGRRALRLAETQIEFHPDDARALCFGAQMLAQMGERARSLDWARRALKIDSEEPAILYNVACVYALAGQEEESISFLEKSLRHNPWFKGWAENDPDLDCVRSHPRFQALLKSQ